MRSLSWYNTVFVKQSGAETEIFQDNKINTMAVDAQASCITYTSAATKLTMQD